MTITRMPPGYPTGGQFAGRARPDAENVELGSTASFTNPRRQELDIEIHAAKARVYAAAAESTALIIADELPTAATAEFDQSYGVTFFYLDAVRDADGNDLLADNPEQAARIRADVDAMTKNLDFEGRLFIGQPVEYRNERTHAGGWKTTLDIGQYR